MKVTPNADKLKDHPIFEMPIIDFTKQDAILAAEIEYKMEKFGKKKPRVDSLILGNWFGDVGTNHFRIGSTAETTGQEYFDALTERNPSSSTCNAYSSIAI